MPVRITGALEKPDIAVDFGELAAKSGVGLVRSLGKAKLATGDAKEKIGEKLRGLFGR